MSRIGRLPIQLPKGVTFSFADHVVTVKGPKGELKQLITDGITLEKEGDSVIVKRPSEQKRHKALHGLYRQLVANMVQGVSEGFQIELELHGIGFRAKNTGQLLELALGYSHPIMFYLPNEVKVETFSDKGKPPVVKLFSSDKQLLGQISAKIRSFRKNEPYKGKGVRFKDEEIRRKAGKTASK